MICGISSWEKEELERRRERKGEENRREVGKYNFLLNWAS